jgi:hypothetical protein
LRAKTARDAISQSSASPSLIVHSSAVRLATGSAPGKPRQTGQVCVFSPPPKPLAQRQNIFVRVFNWTWISRPTTGSQFSAPTPAKPASPLLRGSVEPTPRPLI